MVVGIWCSVGVEDVSADARVPLEHALESVPPYAHYFPFQSTKWDHLFPAIQTGHRSVLACKVRVCFSCTRGFGVGAGKQGRFVPVAAPPWRRRWCESGEDIWARLLLRACKRTWWCLASVLSLLLKFHVRGVLSVLFKILFHVFLKITLISEVSLLFF